LKILTNSTAVKGTELFPLYSDVRCFPLKYVYYFRARNEAVMCLPDA